VGGVGDSCNGQVKGDGSLHQAGAVGAGEKVDSGIYHVFV
jgi:hypothetical protein